MNVLSACADPDTDAWTKWLEQALGSMGMQNMLKQAPDEAKDVYLDATRHSSSSSSSSSSSPSSVPVATKLRRPRLS